MRINAEGQAVTDPVGAHRDRLGDLVDEHKGSDGGVGELLTSTLGEPEQLRPANWPSRLRGPSTQSGDDGAGIAREIINPSPFERAHQAAGRRIEPGYSRMPGIGSIHLWFDRVRRHAAS